ncbi:MAG: hypothetical protein CMH36_13375, partial [Microbacterium sp.]|nr:hypothetical protein [Microbacterium sp.]
MQRLVVTLLAALDAFVAAAISVGAAVVPLALLWITAVSGAGPAALWQATAAVWQLGHGVPLSVTLPTEYLVQAGIDDTAATFTLSLAPLAFLAFTFFFAARSGSRAAQAGAWVTGVVSGVVVFAAASALIALTGAQPLASAALWQALLFPPLVYLAGALAGAIARAWSDGDDGLIDAVRSRTDALPGIWPEVPGLAVRGAVTALTALVGVSALAFAVAVIVRGTAIVTLAQQGGVDLIGAVMIELGQLVYLPTLIVWTMSYLAGPGFALGAGSTISPVGTHAGVVPGVPVLAALPPSGTVWLLALVLLPIAAGAVAGWVVRSR